MIYAAYVAAHVDRARFPERAAEIDAELRRREALPIEEQEPAVFSGTLDRGLGAEHRRPDVARAGG